MMVEKKTEEIEREGRQRRENHEKLVEGEIHYIYSNNHSHLSLPNIKSNGPICSGQFVNKIGMQKFTLNEEEIYCND